MNHRYTVFFDQIEQTNFDVWAKNAEEAEKKGRKHWAEFLNENKHNSATVERQPDAMPKVEENEEPTNWDDVTEKCPICGSRVIQVGGCGHATCLDCKSVWNYDESYMVRIRGKAVERTGD